MSQAVRNLEPRAVWQNFADLNAVPRPSKKEERVIKFIQDFGERLHLPVYTDEAGNVIIKKPASPGMEDRMTVVLQSHLDMVHQKNNDTEFDFDTQGIEMYTDGDWVKAKGTTLGADNGLGVASIMALLESKDIKHPPLEALFTIDEETGMTGALHLKGGLLDADIMLNLDTEDDDELTIGCAGGIDITAQGDYREQDAPSDCTAYRLTVKGLTGGHSGMDIYKGRGNANKLINRVLYRANENMTLYLSAIDGGGLRNAIPRESAAILAVNKDDAEIFGQIVREETDTLRAEYAVTDPNLTITLEKTEMPAKVMNQDFQGRLLRAVYAIPNGIYRMSPDIEHLVQTSNNLARVLVKDNDYEILCLTRSSVDTEKYDLAHSIKSVFQLLGARTEFGGSYPGWTPDPNAPIVEIMSNLYRERFNEEPNVNACHAGLECGILGTNYPAMQMISFGPNIRGAHSPDERAQISSVQKYWGFLLETLERIPVKS